MSIRTQRYSEDKIYKHLDYLKMYEQEGEPLEFEILIDGMRAVRRTDNPNKFSLFENFINEDTQKVEVIIYQGTSNHNDKYIYTLKEEPQREQETLGDIDLRIEERVKEAERKWKFQLLETENKELKKTIEELEEEVEGLEREKASILSKQSPMKGILGEVGASFVEAFIRNNPQMLKGLPGGQALAGMLERDENAPEVEEEETEVSFKPKERKTEKRERIEDNLEVFVEKLRSYFNEQEFNQVLEILERLALNKERIEETLENLKEA